MRKGDIGEARTHQEWLEAAQKQEGEHAAMNEAFQVDLRDAREHGAFQGKVFLTCDNVSCPVGEVELRVNEGRPGSRPLQTPLLCCRCREPLAYHDLEG